MRFKIDWASLIVGSKFIVFALFYFVFEVNFPSTSPRGPYIWWGDLTEVFLRYEFNLGGLYLEGLIHGISNQTVHHQSATKFDSMLQDKKKLQACKTKNTFCFSDIEPKKKNTNIFNHVNTE